MDKKIFWIIALVLIFILWIKVDPFAEKDDESYSGPSTFHQESGEPSPYEKDYFKSHPIQTSTPNFAAISNTKEKKESFFNYLAPFANEKNSLILDDRNHIQALIDTNKTLSTEEVTWISTLRKHHKLKTKDSYSQEDLHELLYNLDIIPISLMLAQAANESAWGTSRFATKGNNFFGQWCFSKGCGLVPASRNSGADHEVRKFHDARESVFAYIDNLNRNAAYKKLRSIRHSLRTDNKAITGMDLVHGLESYSERGEEYVKEIEGLIRYNKLWRFNEKLVSSTETN